MSHRNAGGDIFAEEQLLDGHFVGMELPDQLRQVAFDQRQPGSQRHAGRGVDGAVLYHFLRGSGTIQHAKAYDRHTGVYP